jgi:hypothetical protein
MSQGRSVDPIVRTYITSTPSTRRRTRYHVRIYSRDYDLDRRGTATTIDSARDKALLGVPRPRPKNHRQEDL